MDAGLVGRHPEHAQERRQPHLAPRPVAAEAGVGVELPREDRRLALGHVEPVVHEGRPAAGNSQAEGADSHRVDPDLEHLPRAAPTNRDRPDQRVTGVELRVARLETLALRAVGARRLEPPSRIERRESDRVAGVDLEHRLELAREMPVQVAPLERELMERH